MRAPSGEIATKATPYGECDTAGTGSLRSKRAAEAAEDAALRDDITARAKTPDPYGIRRQENRLTAAFWGSRRSSKDQNGFQVGIGVSLR